MIFLSGILHFGKNIKLGIAIDIAAGHEGVRGKAGTGMDAVNTTYLKIAFR